MNPYRETDKELIKEREEFDRLAPFGIRDNGRPILERVKEDPCKKCGGFGTRGNPLAGYVVDCDACEGSGHNMGWEPPKKSFLKRLWSWFK